MLSKIINFSLKNKFIVILFTVFLIGYGFYSLSQLSIGAVPDVTNNQVQVITTSQNLSTQDMEQFITYPVELEMANIPGVTEIRSVSKFGLSVVTIVFEDEMGTYLPRQLIAEKIKSASEKIPEGFGTPEMGPITTGLGEIYQYILDTKPGYKDKYNATQLRTIQDWIVKRQLSGIPGVVEVNSWGGYLKQYEVAIETEKLNAMNISISDVYTALEKNNSVTGGGYIEKVNQAYFIRGEGLVNSLDDIGNIVVKNDNNHPVYIKDIAKVGYGSATRFGAITGNGEGEKVLGQVMMLKDGNSKQVIEAVKKRVEEISHTLPEGVYINAFLDRSELIAKTTFTVSENLILGFLIVIFVVVIFLGNLRSGLVVASVIPLSLMFTFSMMHIFGVDANLMSLGAIDFGIIIDGAVIIVEFIAFQITARKLELSSMNDSEKRDFTDEITFNSATKMMNSAIFGQLIILIVFIPILSLQGVEGKMFKPMAMTFSFALIGAMLLCLTYVPVISSMFLKPSLATDKNISVRIMKFLNSLYDPSIRFALAHKKMIITSSVILLLFSVFLYSKMGGEFVPTLDEGDFVIQPVLKTGTSLSNTIATTTQIEKILLKNFPEVKQVVSRIGAAEVPTDPMSMEESDVIIVLKPKNEWVSASTKDELADKFKEALSIIPGMEVEFTQPIEMRFNELITGVRADIAIKIFGEDLDLLSIKANEVKKLIENVEGAADITVEKTVGLPQMNIKFDRKKIARYGMNIADLNDVIAMGYSGKVMGNVFEGEKRFDLVIRLDKSKRKDISNLKNLYVDTPDGYKIPLSELAEITYKKEAAKISRDNTKRRIVVGINVRNRDLQSVVHDVENIVNEKLDLPPGYTVSYGGQFENLQSAKKRLKIAVPIALILIFILLYFAFQSVKEALMIFSAIPLSAVGGVLFLWLRDMPFSISAGVGFIALFGIAVLNGIVLIEHFKELKEEGIKDMNELIITGTKNRLRAVLLTAMSAALGFLPMAISQGAGAEVQRPLASVVIGGLITSTLLTMIVLPVLYATFEKTKHEKRKRKFRFSLKKLSVLILLMSFHGFAQQKELGLDELRLLAMENNAFLKASTLEVDKADAMIAGAFNFDKTEVYYNYDKNNLAFNNKPLKVYGINQNFLFPTLYFAGKKVNKANFRMKESNLALRKRVIQREVSKAYYRLQYEREKLGVYRYLDSIFKDFSYAAERKFELGETNYLEKITARSKQINIQTLFNQAKDEVISAESNLRKIVQNKDGFIVRFEPLKKINSIPFDLKSHEGLQYFEYKKTYLSAKNKYAKQQYLPDISLNYFVGTNEGLNQNINGYQIGLKIPLLFSGNISKVKTSKIEKEILEQEAIDYKIKLEEKYLQLSAQLKKYDEALKYFEEEGDHLSKEIIKTAGLNYQNGEIDFFQYLQSIENAYGIVLFYLENLNKYNQTVLDINYLTL